MHKDHRKYYKFTGRTRLEKAVNSLVGLVEGISIDGNVNSSEIDFLRLWLQENDELRDWHPFNELIPVIEETLASKVFDDDERQNILWLCEKLQSNEFYNEATANIQRLHAIMAGIASDGVITASELRGLSDWLAEHDQLKTCWPYDEVDSLVTTVLSDGKIDDTEHKLLLGFFSEFVAVLDNKTIVSPGIMEGPAIIGLCAVCPDIKFEGSKFCFTGASAKYSRKEFSKIIEQLNGEVSDSVSSKINYLIIGADGNPCWAYACYGRKVEKAVELRKQGSRILLVHENDFHDAVLDQC